MRSAGLIMAALVLCAGTAIAGAKDAAKHGAPAKPPRVVKAEAAHDEVKPAEPVEAAAKPAVAETPSAEHAAGEKPAEAAHGEAAAHGADAVEPVAEPVAHLPPVEAAQKPAEQDDDVAEKPSAPPSLQPFQMVRSLQLLQDRIAAGDHAALPMQAKMLGLIDGRLRDASSDDLADRRNYRALIVYGMSGGNPATIDGLLKRIELEKDDKRLAKGVLAYLKGQIKPAQNALGVFDPMSFPPETGAFLALVKGSIELTDPKAALTLLDKARLLSPGTLIEEAALRRSLPHAVSLNDTEKFFRLADAYARRYLRSPYASQFADGFVGGVIQLHRTAKFEDIDSVAALMDADQRKVIYLRLARRAAIEGLNDLSVYAAKRAGGDGAADKHVEDPRALLYASLSTVTSENVERVIAQLKAIDRSKLSDSDLQLLRAVETVAAELTQPAKVDETIRSASVTPDAAPEPVAAGGQAAMPDAEAAATSQDGSGPAPVTDEAAAGHQAAPAVPAASGPGKGAAAGDAHGSDAVESMVADTRGKLEAIDKLLGETK